MATQSFQLIRTRIWHYKKGDIYAVSSKTAGAICALDYFVNMRQKELLCYTDLMVHSLLVYCGWRMPNLSETKKHRKSKQKAYGKPCKSGETISK